MTETRAALAAPDPADARAFQERIDTERLQAAAEEFERHERVRRVLLFALEATLAQLDLLTGKGFAIAPSELRDLTGELEGVVEVLRGDWLQSPQTMRARRAAGGT